MNTPNGKLNWRNLEASDTAALINLQTQANQADNIYAYPLYNPDSLDQASFTTAAFKAGQMVAASLATVNQEVLNLSLSIHPDERGYNLGQTILRWAENIAYRENLTEIILRDEADTYLKQRSFINAGYERFFAEHILVRLGEQPLPDMQFPAEYRAQSWTTENQADFHRAYLASFVTRTQHFLTLEEYLNWNLEDNDFRPDMSWLLYDGPRPIAYVTVAVENEPNPYGLYGCWVSQIGVDPEYRRNGLASALLAQVLKQSQAEGLDYNILHSNEDNTSAYAAYLKLDYDKKGARARYRFYPR
ncbi:hypothetical protein MASR2M15_26160 [Anaerolineales bacterium]